MNWQWLRTSAAKGGHGILRAMWGTRFLDCSTSLKRELLRPEAISNDAYHVSSFETALSHTSHWVASELRDAPRPEMAVMPGPEAKRVLS